MYSSESYNTIYKTLRRCGFFARLVLVWAMVFAQTLPLYANPVDGVVSAGSANIDSVGNTLTVTQATDKAVIDWRGFDIANGETTQFRQPSASSMTLNRVNSNAPSFIDGNLTANGNLIVVNPNGVWFGSGARVDVNGLIASTAGISNDAFMKSTGVLDFDIAGNPDAGIINDGLITAKEAGLVGLVAPNVINRGIILARLGRVALASGDTATVDMYGDGLINVAVSDKVKSQLVSNSGLIVAEGGTIALTAAAGKDIVNSLIKVSGELAAPSVSQRNGKIIIGGAGSNKTSKQGYSTVLVSGVLDASGRNAGERGGSIVVTGDNIGLLSGTRIDASGSDGLSGTTLGKLASAVRVGSAGGDIRIGGDYLGQGDTPTALNLYVDSDALILNDAVNSGDAGRTIFWSDGLTQFYGNVYARALAGNGIDQTTWHAIEGGTITSNTGDGGFVETSGHRQLDVGGYVDLTASNGARGTYFLDPTNITIYGNFAPNYATVIQGDSTALSANLKLWLDASDTTKVNLTYSALTTAGANACASSCLTASGISGATTITTSANIASTLQVGQRIRLGSAGSVTAASTLGADTYTISAIAGTTITLSTALTTTYSSSTVYAGYVSQLTDKSGNAANATQSTAANMPLWISNGQNGLGVISLDGVNDALGGTLAGLGLSGNASKTIFVSARPDSVTSGGVFFDMGSDSSLNSFGLAIRNNSKNTLFEWGGDIDGSIQSNGIWRIWEGLKNGNAISLYTDGVADGSATPGAANIVNETYQIGKFNVSGGWQLLGRIADTVLYVTALSTNAQALVNQYQSAKWGVALTPPGSGATEVAKATASIQKGDAVDGYSVFTTRYLERLSQSANISLRSSNNITLDLQGDTMNFATAGRTLTLTAGNQITTASTGTITTNGGAISMYANDSIVFNHALTLNSNGGAILLNADRDASGAGAVKLTSTVINSGGGSVTIGGGSGTITAGTGYAVGSGAVEDGVLMTGGSINAAGGNIIINGKSAVTTTSFISGVSLDSSANVNTTGAGTISIYGLGNTGTGTSNRGVRIVNGATVTAVNGTLTLNGTGGGSGTAANNYGVFLGGTNGFVSTNGSGNISVTGVGGNSGGSGGINYGVYITTAGSYIKTTGTGSITINGTKGGQSNSYGFLTDIANAVTTSNTAGNITLLSDTVSLSGAGAGYNISAAGSLTIAPLTAITMGVGSSAGGALNFTDTVLANLNAGSFTFGSLSAGNLTINTARNFGTSNVTFTTGGSISLANTLTSSSGNISLNKAVTLTATSSINAGTGNATFASTIDGGFGLTVNAATISLGGAAGGTTALGAVSMTAVNTVSLPSINANTISVQTTAVGGKISLSGALTASATSGNGIVLNAGNEIATTVASTMTTSGSNIVLTGANGIGLYHAYTLSSSGGNITFNSPLYLGAAQTISAGSGIVTFASTVDSLTPVSAANVLVVAGGGGGGGGTGGGGGGGGVLNNTAYALTTNSAVTVTVGAGGAAGSAIGVAGSSGGNSVFGSLTAIGGGGGGANNSINGLTGGSGGGGAWNSSGAAGTAGQGFAGAAGAAAGPPNYGAGGGGGAGGVGTIGTTTVGGNGGAGLSNSITGSAVTYAGGGGGGVYNGGTIGSGGAGGGGSGGSNAVSGVAGTNGLGGGGGGAGQNTGNGGAGGTGVVVVRYTGRSGQATITGNATSTTVGSDTVWTFTSSGSFTANSVGCVGGCGLTVTAGTINMSGAVGGTTALGAVALTSINSITLPSITASTVNVQATAATADITIGASKVVTTTGTGTPLTLVAGRNFINNAGAGALATPSGRWLVYSTNPANDTIGSVSNSFRRFSCTYGGSCPAMPGTGNGLLYRTTPTLTATPNSLGSMVYGASAPSLSGYAYTLSGYLGSDSSADSVTGSLTGSSSYVAGSNIGTYGINYSLGTLSSTMGYAFTYANNAAAFTVTARAITISADAKTKVYGAVDPTLTYQITSGSMYGSDGFTGALTRAAGQNVGSYGIAQNTLSAGGNYTITYIGKNMSITPAALTVTANAQTKVYGADDPTLTYAYSGLANNDNSTVFTGALSRVSGETVLGGPYTINQNTLSAGSNYTMTFTGNNLTITPAVLTVTANNVNRAYSAQDPALTYAISGLANGDTASVVTGKLSRVTGTMAGNYAILQNTIAATANYILKYIAGKFRIAENEIPVTVTRVSQDPTLNMSGNNANTVTSNQPSTQPSSSPKSDNSKPTVTDIRHSGGGWLTISPDLLAMLGGLPSYIKY